MEDKGKKKNQDELKKKLHELIDSIDDEPTLSMLNEDVVPYVIENRTKELDNIEDNLTDEQLKDLDESIAEANRGETISYEEFKKNMDEWFTRLKSTGDSK